MTLRTVQGAHLSPSLFNMSVNHIFDELPECNIAKENGFDLITNRLQPFTVLGFADDTVLVAEGLPQAMNLLSVAHTKFSEIGLTLNAQKSSAIVIENGLLEKKKHIFSRWSVYSYTIHWNFRIS